MRITTESSRGDLRSPSHRGARGTSEILRALCVGVASTAMIACAPDPSGSPYEKGRTPKDTAEADAVESSKTTRGTEEDRAPEEPNPIGVDISAKPDGDGDGVPDDVDCDPASPALAGTRLLDDTLGDDKGLFTAVTGFPQASWTHDGAALRQGRVVNASDMVAFNQDAAIGDVVVEVRAASTEIAAITPRLRQMFIVIGATLPGGELSGVGCGVEVVEGDATTQKTSVVRLSGPPNAVTTTPLERVNRAALQVNEEFTMKARVAQGTLTCEVTQAATTTATATNLGALTGSVGLFTRQTKALFKNARICKLK